MNELIATAKRGENLRLKIVTNVIAPGDLTAFNKIMNKAISCFQSVVDKTESPKLKAWGYAHLGATYCLDANNYDTAVEAFEQMDSLKPDYAWGYAHQGEAHRLRGLRTLVNLPTIDPLGGAKSPPGEGDFLAAISAFNKVLGANEVLPLGDNQDSTPLNPNDHWACAHRGATYFFYSKLPGPKFEETKKPIMAGLADLQKATELSDDYVWALTYLSECHHHLALIYGNHEKNWEEAYKHWYHAYGSFGEAVLVDPDLFKITYLDVAKGRRINIPQFVEEQKHKHDHPFAAYIGSGYAQLKERDAKS